MIFDTELLKPAIATREYMDHVVQQLEGIALLRLAQVSHEQLAKRPRAADDTILDLVAGEGRQQLRKPAVNGAASARGVQRHLLPLTQRRTYSGQTLLRNRRRQAVPLSQGETAVSWMEQWWDSQTKMGPPLAGRDPRRPAHC